MLSGVGISGESEIRAVFDPSVSYTDDFDSLELHILRRTDDPTIYVFHDACWQLLLSRLIGREAGDAKSRALHVAKLLFHLLRCLPKDRHGALRIENDYGGAAKFLWHYAYTRGGYERSLSEDWRFLLASPGCDTTGEANASLAKLAEAWKLTHDYATTDRGHPAVRGNYRDCGKDPFGRLPPEMLDLLFVELASTDLCSLRLASKAVANLSSPDHLSQSFWESRFTDGFEMESFFTCRPHHAHRREIDWQALYSVVKKCLAEGPLRAGLRNRKRIWTCLSYFTSSLEVFLGGANPPLPLAVTESSSTRSSLPEELLLGSIARSHALHEYTAHHILFPTSSRNTQARLSASFIWLNRRRYICGLRLRSNQGDSVEALPHEAGIVIPEAEEQHDFPLDDVTGINVYTAVDGIVGLEFYCRGERKMALGHCSVLHGEVAVAELSLRKYGSLRGLMITFDVRNQCISMFSHVLTYPKGLQSYCCSSSRRTDEPSNTHHGNRERQKQRNGIPFRLMEG